MIIEKHLFRTLFLAILVTMIGLGLIDYILTLLNELNYRLEGEYRAAEAFRFVTLTTPGRLYDFFPYIVLIGTLFAFGELADHRELVIMEAAGKSKPKIVLMSLYAPILWLFIAFSIGETLVQRMDQAGYELRNVAAAKGSTRYGVWHRDGNDYFFFNAIKRDGSVSEGFSVSHDDGVLNYRPFEAVTVDGDSFTFVDRKHYRYSSEGTWTELSQTTQESWSTQLTPELLWLLTSPDAKLSVFKLWEYSNYLEAQKLSDDNFRLKFWQRVLQPVLSIALIWLAITFIFGPLRQSSTGARMFAGLMLAISFNLIQSLVVPLADTLKITEFAAAGIPIGVATVMIFFLQMRKAL